jgi:predicted nucleotidyltransferase
MLQSLYVARSKIRQDLLALFFTNPSQRYYLRELQRILGYSAGSIRRELLKFQGDGLFDTERVGNLLYYSLNSKHPLFREIRSIIFKTVGVEGSLRRMLLSIGGIKIAFIYGSFASKKEKVASDIDLMIIGNPDNSYLNRKIAELEKRLRREINPTVYSLREYRAKKRAKSGFLLELLENPRIMLIGRDDDL